MSKSKVKPYLYLLPGLILLVLFIYYPIGRNIQFSFQKWDLFSGVSTPVGFKNFANLLKAKDFWTAFQNNVWYIAISLVFQVGVALVFAAFLENMQSRRLSTLLRTVFFLPSLISLTVIGLLFTFIYRPDGLLNSLLQLMNLSGWTHGWLGEAQTAIFSVIAVSQWKSIGYTMMLLIVAIQKIPKDINEAACIDGASKVQTFFHVTVPSIKGMIKIATMINITGGLLVFNEIYIMTSGGPYGSSEVLSTLMYKNAFVHGKVGYAAAIADIILVLSMIFSGLQFVSFEREGQGKGKKPFRKQGGQAV